MLTINDILNQIGELQGEVWIRQWDYGHDDYSFDRTMDGIESNHPIRNKPIKYIYADTKPPEKPWKEPEAVLYIEVEGDE